MQHQKTAPAKIEISRELSVNEQKFVEALAEGCDNTEAYRRAYGAEGYSPAALHVRACRKVAEPHIRSALSDLRAAGFTKGRLSLEARIEWEMAFAERCEQSGNMGAAGAASDRIHKLMGLYTEQVEFKTSDPLQALNEIAKTSPDIARQLAIQSGIDWPANEPSTALN